MKIRFSINDFFIIFYTLLPIISLNRNEFFSIGVAYYFLMSSLCLIFLRLNLSIFNLKRISKIIKRYIPDRFDYATFTVGIFLISFLIFIRIFKYGNGIQDILSIHIITRLRESWFLDSNKLTIGERIISILTYVFSYYNFLILIKKLIILNKFRFHFLIPWTLISLINGSRNMILFILIPITIILILNNTKSIFYFFKYFRLKRRIIFLLLSLFFIGIIGFALNLSRTIHHEDYLSMYKNMREDTCLYGYFSLDGEKKYFCTEVYEYTGILPLSLNPFYFSHGIINLNILLKDDDLSLYKDNAIDNLLRNFTKKIIPTGILNINKFNGHGLGGATLFGDLIKKYVLLSSLTYPLIILIFKKIINFNIPLFIKFLMLNILFLNLILMPFFEGIGTILGTITIIPIILLPIYSILLFKIEETLDYK